ncbi:MAG: cysteine hydrolase [Candidatus Edwardsbacteria bacterium]|jgi:nicotinamidase-related amidase|nr:cysteine hydrolase [Candidatus Edwardsbacteria bacterium]
MRTEAIAKPALLVVDVQNYFFDRRSPAFLKASARILPRINRLAAAARKAGWPVIYTVHCRPGDRKNLMAARWKHLPAGAESDPYPGLHRRVGEAVIKKEHYSAFMGTGLTALLKKKGVRDIVLCGVMTHLCVDTTARHGLMLGFRPVIAGDACCSKDAGYHRAALRCLRHGFARVATTDGLLGAMACAT